MEYPTWLGQFGKKDEALRKHHGLQPKKDGWYKTIALKKRYIARPMPLADVLKILPSKTAEIVGSEGERPAVLAVASTTIEGLAEMYLAHLWQRHLTSQPRSLERRTYDDYVEVLDRFTRIVGVNEPATAVDPSWFTKFMRTISDKAVTSQNRDLIYLTAFFNWAGPGRHSLNFYKQVVKFGADFRKPGQAMMRSSLANYSTLYTADQFAAAVNLVAPSPLLYAVGLLALNCAYLPEDVATVPLTAINLETGIVEFPRKKTKIARKALLRAETREAIEHYLRFRPDNADPAGPIFVRDDGKPFCQRRETGPNERSGHGNPLSQYWGAVTGRPLKGLRTTFATEADGFHDQSAVDLVMGHAPKSIRAKHYVKSFAPERLLAVVDLVWQRVVPPELRQDVAELSAFGLVKRVGSRAAILSKSRARRAARDTVAA